VSLHVKTSAAILVMVVFGPLGNVLLGMGMRRIAASSPLSPAVLFALCWRAFGSGLVWLGIAALIAFLLAQLLVLSWADYSYVQPASSASYGIVALLGSLLLGEVVSPVRWAGIVVICVGVLIVGRTHPRTTYDDPPSTIPHGPRSVASDDAGSLT
jgi:drug/metabolite transporter (DMT)-like permease